MVTGWFRLDVPVGDAAVGAAPALDGVGARRRRGGGSRLDRRWLTLAVAVTAVPILLAVVRALTTDWVPVNDLAFLEARVRDVGGADTPLTGMYSRFGFDHPGPIAIWSFALPYRVAGGDPSALLVAAAVVNLFAVTVAILVANRRGGRPLVAVTVVALLLLEGAMAANGSDLIDPWNPTVAVLALVALLFVAWDVARGRLQSLWLLVLLVSWVVQSHGGHLPIAAALVVGVAAVLAARTVRREQRWSSGPVVIALLVGVVVWSGPLVDQIAGSGNLAEIVESTSEASEPRVGLPAAAGVLAVELAPSGPWSGGHERIDPQTAGVTTASLWRLVAPIAGLAGVAFAGRRLRRPDLLVLAALIAVTAGCGWLAIGVIPGPPLAYLVQWTWALATVIYLSAVWALLLLADDVGSIMRSRAAGVVAVVITLLTLTLASVASLRADLPWEPFSTSTIEVSAALRAVLDPAERHSVVLTGSGLGHAGPAVQLDLERHGFDVCGIVEPGRGEELLGPGRACRGPTTSVVVVATDAASIEALHTDPTVDVVAEHLSLTPAERAELDRPETDLQRILELVARDSRLAAGVRSTGLVEDDTGGGDRAAP